VQNSLMVTHPKVLRFSPDPLQRRLYRHWREKYGTLILQSRMQEHSQERSERWLDSPAGETSNQRAADIAPTRETRAFAGIVRRSIEPHSVNTQPTAEFVNTLSRLRWIPLGEPTGPGRSLFESHESANERTASAPGASVAKRKRGSVTTE